MSTKIDSLLVKDFRKIVESSEFALIVPHINPDGDAIGSCLALNGFLKNLNHKSRVIIPNEFPDFLQWMDGADEVVDFEKSPDEVKQLFLEADTLFCLDFNDFERSEGMKELLSSFKGKKVVVDHHPSPVANCNLLISYTTVSSTCELLFRLIEEAGLLNYLDKKCADAIFVGIMTDTGNFSYNASDPDTYYIVAKLLEKGIDKDLIHSNVYHTFSEDRWRLIGHSLKDKMVILPEYRTGYISLSKEELDQFNFQPGDTEGLVNYPLSVKGVVFCALFIEKDDQIKLSFRSKGNFSTNDFSRKHFNGGGHINASGGSIKVPLNEAIDLFEKLLKDYQNELLNCF
jgi:bifunctional oligoribonuclease and PAP phosphatase NrnA